ncbi:MAG: hypothetical protein AAFY25_12050, partial [Pseudomonadota bacterium]
HASSLSLRLILKRVFCLSNSLFTHSIAARTRTQTTNLWPFDAAVREWMTPIIAADQGKLAKRGTPYPVLKEKPLYKIDKETRKRVRKFVTNQAHQYIDEIRKGVSVDDTISEVFCLFR